MLTIGYDIGTSSIKASLFDSQSGSPVCSAVSPEVEMSIDSPQPGWAQQDPQMWWDNVVIATRKLLEAHPQAAGSVRAIGISYQMHGLVCVDSELKPVYPAIIWCDNRSLAQGQQAVEALGSEYWLDNLLNLPGCFTAAKLAWLKENEPEVFSGIHKVMLPGDYIAMKLSGQCTTTRTGLSEGIFWNYRLNQPDEAVLDHFGFPNDVLSEIVPAVGFQGKISTQAAQLLGLGGDVSITYRAGDQPNNAFSLKVFNPGEVAATAGTSAVIYAVSDTLACDPLSRVNNFLHVTSSPETRLVGILLCINGSGIANRWLRNNICGNDSYERMNEMASSAKPGSDGLSFLPYGNGAERTLEYRQISAGFCGLDFHRHTKAHLVRAVQEGIVFAMNYGLDICRETAGLEPSIIRAGRANMFLSPVFRQTFANVTGACVELYDTDGSQGAARGAALGAGGYASEREAFETLEMIERIEPDAQQTACRHAYDSWLGYLERMM